MDLAKLKDEIKGLLDDKATPELAEKIGKINATIETLEKSNEEDLAKFEDLRKKYVNLVKDYSFKIDGTPIEKEDESPKSLEECYEKIKSKN